MIEPDRKQRRLAVLERSAVLVALIYVIACLVFPVSSTSSATPVMAIEGSGFRAGAVYPTTDTSALPGDVATVGSWLGGDASTGEMRTPWKTVSPPAVYVFVAGYPNGPHMELRAETRCGQRVSSQPITGENPGEHWNAVTLQIGPCSGGDTAVRLVARDGSRASRGWLGVSEILSALPGHGVPSIVSQLLRMAGCTVLAFVLVFVPGLVLARFLPVFESASLVALPGLTLLLLTGFCGWVLLKRDIGQSFCSTIVIIALLALLWFMCADPVPLTARLPYRRVFAVAACMVVIASGRALYSLGPANELYGGSISRTFEPGDRSDSRISYHVLQIVTNGAGPYSTLAQLLLSPWTFSDRGPIAGIAASPIVLASGAAPPAAKPEQRWRPFDEQGFAAYRAAMFVFASTVVFSLFGFVIELAGVRAGLFAVAVAALSPFVLHETWFTWPKLFATSIALVAAFCVVRKRYVTAGAFVGIAYLIHPSALFVIPALCAYAATLNRFSRRRIATALGLLFVGPLAAFAAWRFLNGAHYSQSSFFNFFFLDDNTGPGLLAWLRERFVSLADTLVPFLLPFANGSNPEINALGGVRSSLADHLDFAYWCTLPFAIGLWYLVRFSRLTVLAARRALLPFLGIVVVPFAIFWLYWGGASSGLMREGLHWWFFVLIAFVVVAVFRSGVIDIGTERRGIRLRTIEIAALALLPAILDSRRIVSSTWQATDALALLVVIAGCALLAWVALPPPLLDGSNELVHVPNSNNP